MPPWTPCPIESPTRHDRASVSALWNRLHIGDVEALPDSEALLDAWVLYHNGAFEAAQQAALSLGAAGLTLAHKATCIYASYVEPHETTRLDLLLSVAESARQQQSRSPRLPGAWYWHGYALGRYSQGVSVAKALARGLGQQVRKALETTLVLAPTYADAHLALANFHAEVIDKVGEMIGSMVHGARKDEGLAHFEAALALNPESAIVHYEYANGRLMLEGVQGLGEATRLREAAASIVPLDAMEQLYVALARAEPDG